MPAFQRYLLVSTDGSIREEYRTREEVQDRLYITGHIGPEPPKNLILFGMKRVPMPSVSPDGARARNKRLGIRED